MKCKNQFSVLGLEFVFLVLQCLPIQVLIHFLDLVADIFKCENLRILGLILESALEICARSFLGNLRYLPAARRLFVLGFAVHPIQPNSVDVFPVETRMFTNKLGGIEVGVGTEC
jgi:hypothetical protein